jgi:serine/threonine protein kinase
MSFELVYNAYAKSGRLLLLYSRGIYTGGFFMIETVPSGTVLHGRYRIERVLGSGGFGHVYVAVDLSSNQQYAVKEYLVTGPSGQEQLKHEARVLSQLHHPNLPAFQDAFIERGRYYVVLNYIEGSDLTDLIRMTRQRNEVIPLRQMLNWLLSICDAVMFLHSQNPIIIHRDIKPDNIRIMPDGTAVLVDLGNAKAAADGARTLFFIRHQGTPGYAPPEQYPGGTGTDARSDVYALAGTLYFALTAHEPPSVSVRNQSLQQGRPDLPTLQEHLRNNPPEESPEANAAKQFRLGVSKPSKPVPRHSRHIAQLGSLSPEVLNQLNRIIQRAMALKPQERYQYVADFANDLKSVIALLPAPPQSTPPQDPHSTQPDLPEIYDAIVAAKERANQDGPPPPAPIRSIPSSTMTCPRCGNTLAHNAAFCPRCGASISNVVNMQAASPKAKMTTVAPDQTIFMTHEQMMQEATANASQQSPGIARSTTISSPGTLRPNSTIYQQNGTGSPVSTAQNAATHNAQRGQSLQQAPAPANVEQASTQNTLSQAKSHSKLLIYFIIALVVLIALVVIFLVLIQHIHATALIESMKQPLAFLQGV